jgi:serine/threonine protein kinase
MAEVWRVVHVHLGTPHALKVLHQTTSEIRARLMEEGRIQARLQHPNLVRVTDVVELPSGIGLVMDLVEGPSLRALMDRERLPLEQALALGADIINGVAYAHTAGLIHRDLKPDNILLVPRGEDWLPRVADFGLAKALNLEGPTRTRTGMAMGAPVIDSAMGRLDDRSRRDTR